MFQSTSDLIIPPPASTWSLVLDSPSGSFLVNGLIWFQWKQPGLSVFKRISLVLLWAAILGFTGKRLRAGGNSRTTLSLTLLLWSILKPWLCVSVLRSRAEAVRLRGHGKWGLGGGGGKLMFLPHTFTVAVCFCYESTISECVIGVW